MTATPRRVTFTPVIANFPVLGSLNQSLVILPNLLHN